jgi:hypothetical protein
MAHYLVSARPLTHRLPELEERLGKHAFVDLEPFGRALSSGLSAARKFPNGTAVWEEEDYCRPPLAQERAAVLDHYFEGLEVQQVERGSGWELIAELPLLFPALASDSPSDSARVRS